MAQSNIGKYQVLEEIAAGRQGVVYRAFDPEAGQIVALKVLHASLTGDLSYAERFRREASLTASINHPNVVKIFEVGQDGDRHFMALELLPENLARIIESGGQMLIDRAAEFCVQIAKGLAAAHALGIVHRDVKPQNVLIGQDGTAKVTDFGIARAEELSTMTATGTVMGTPHYMSPEQAQGERADARSDVYSLGCMLYQMLVGEVPFKGDTPLAVVRQHVDQKPRPLQALRQNLPRELVSVVERAMAKSPARRFQSASEMADALRAAVPGVATARPAEPPSPPEPPRDRGAAAPPRPTPEAPRGARPAIVGPFPLRAKFRAGLEGGAGRGRSVRFEQRGHAFRGIPDAATDQVQDWQAGLGPVSRAANRHGLRAVRCSQRRRP